MKAILVLLCALGLTSPAFANDEARLEALKTEIRKLENWLKEAQKESGQLSEALRKSDLEISELSKQIERTRQQLAEENERLKKLRQEQGQLRELQNQHRQHLAEQLRSAQRLGDDGPIKLLLNQNDPQQAQRMLRYFAYFNAARMERINEILSELKRLDNLATLISEAEQTLRKTERQQLQNSRNLQQRKQEQERLLTRLRNEMGSEKQRLSNIEADRQRLEKLLTDVQTVLDNSPRKNDARPIAQLKGKLPRPLNNRVLQAFNNRSNDGKRPGWLMAATEGESVRAVHHGRVVFSDWLRGYGLIMIIDHGQGYLSLYAHNQTLLRDVGSWVNQGDIIAHAGRSGGSDSASLYFEIRHRGKPQDPAAWLRR